MRSYLYSDCCYHKVLSIWSSSFHQEYIDLGKLQEILNKGFRSKFTVDYPDQYTHGEGQRAQQSKYDDDNNSLNVYSANAYLREINKNIAMHF